MPNVIDLTTKEFSKFLSSSKCVVDFSAEWCGPCKALSPVFKSIANEMPEVSFAKIDIDDNHEVAAKYNIKSVPCILVFKDGNEVGRITGFSPEMKTKLRSILNG